MTLGYKNYKVTGGGYTKLYRLVMKEKIPVRNMREKKDCLYLTLSVEYCGEFERLCIENGYETEVLKQKGMINVFSFFKRRIGFVAGGIVVLGLCLYLSNIALRFDVLCDDEAICKSVMDVLADEGIKAGSYIPDINLVVVERALKQNVDGISWAGITVKGNSLIIDVVEEIEKPKIEYERLPTNLVACENGVIEKLEVFGGQVLLGVGCGVTKGDIIVSGEVVETESTWIDGKENIDVDTSYVRSKGQIYGTFERTVTFEQPFEDEKEYVTDNVIEKNFLTFFDAEIPLFLNSPKGYYSSEESENKLNFFGRELPIGIKKLCLTEYDFETTTYDEEQALELAQDKAYRYEENFLSNFEIKDRQSEEEITETGAKLTVTYTLYGVMSREVEFFVNK